MKVPKKRADSVASSIVPRKQIDSVDIARMVGVARSTVSKVLNGYPNISEETRERVLKAVRENQYYPNLSARTLAGKRTNTLGLFFFNAGHFSEDVLVNFMISRVIESAASLGHHVLTYIVRNPIDRSTLDSIREVFHQHRVTGGVFIGARDREPIIEELVEEGFAVGVFDESVNGRTEPNRVIVNFSDRGTASQVITYLVSLGHADIAVLHGDPARNAGRAKHRGYLAGMRKHGIEVRPEWQVSTDFTSSGGYVAMNQVLASSAVASSAATPRLPTAVAASNDSVAFGAMRSIEEAGLRVPGDISVIGIDGHPLGAYVRPGLTTFEYDFSATVNSLIEGVIAAVDGTSDALRQRTFSAKLIVRNSCAER